MPWTCSCQANVEKLGHECKFLCYMIICLTETTCDFTFTDKKGYQLINLGTFHMLQYQGHICTKWGFWAVCELRTRSTFFFSNCMRHGWNKGFVSTAFIDGWKKVSEHFLYTVSPCQVYHLHIQAKWSGNFHMYTNAPVKFTLTNYQLHFQKKCTIYVEFKPRLHVLALTGPSWARDKHV